MRKCYSFLKRSFVIMLLSVVSIGALHAQTDITIGTGTSTNSGTTFPAPLQDWYEGSRAQFLYTAADLNAAGMSVGMITAIKYNITGLNTYSGDIQQLSIRVGTTSTNSLDLTSWEPSPATVFGPVDYVATTGINSFTLSTPVFWNGTDNILIEICNGLPGNESDGLQHYTNNPSFAYTTVGYNASHTRIQDAGGNLCATPTTTNTGTATNRPNITFTWTAATACTGTPSAGTAVATPSAVCLGENFTLSATGVTVASGLTYQWQSSPDNSTWTNIPGATNLSLNTTQSASTYYRLVVTCANSGASANSTSAQVSSPTLVQGTFTINSAVATGGTNFQSFNDAYNYIKCGITAAVVFNVDPASGPYNEQLIMTNVPGSSSTNTVTFNGNGRTIAFGSNSSGERAVIHLDGANFIIFDSLVIDASSGTYGYGVQLTNDADSNIVRNSIINTSLSATTQNFAGIVVGGTTSGPISTSVVLSDDNLFLNNTINGGYAGIAMAATTAGASGRNQFINNDILDFYQYGVYVAGSYNTVIEGNLISRPTRSTVTNFEGIYFTGVNTFATVAKNRITNPFGGSPASTSSFTGINFNAADATSSNENIVSNNVIYNVNGNGAITGISNTSSDNVWFLHNTISLDNVASTSTATTRGFYQTTLSGGIFFFNNIVSIGRGGAGTKHAVYLNTATSGVVLNNNNYYISATSGNNYIGYFSGQSHSTLLDWQTATGDDAASISNNPFYLDAANGNLMPSNAAVDNKGLFVGITTDILDQPRSATTPDMGAYEFTAPPCVTPPVPGTTILSSTIVCQNEPVTLNLSLTSWGAGQTFQWESSPNIGGPWISVSGLMPEPMFTFPSTTSLYYRAAVSCGGSTVYSDAVLLNVNPALPAGTYTIDKNNPTTYTGPSTGTNFNSFNDAKAAMFCGITGGPVVFNVVSGSGPYAEQLVLDSIPGVSAVNTITFNGNGNTISFNSITNSERAVIKLNGTDYIIFDSLTIDASGGTYGYGIQLINNADSNIVRNSTIISSTASTGATYAGIVINSSHTDAITAGSTLSDGNLFDDNSIIGGNYGITVVGSSSEPVNDNKFTNNRIEDFYNYGIYVVGTYNTLIEGNTISRPTRVTTAASVYGVYMTTTASDRLTVNRNTFTNPFGGAPLTTAIFYGVYHNNVDAASGNESIISNNIFRDLNGNGSLYPLYNVGSNNVFYYHNTISLDNTASTVLGNTAAFYQTTSATNIRFINNLITISRGGNGNKYGIYLSTAASQVESDYNNVFINVAGGSGYFGYNGSPRATLADWQAATGLDLNSFDYDPLYSDLAAGDLKPNFLPLDNQGLYVNIDTDYYNQPRSATTPDIGAIEFIPAPCTSPPVAGTSTVTPSSGICLESPISLTLTGHSPIGTTTFQWQYSPDGVTWTNLSGILYTPDYDTVATTNTYYRAAVTCNGNTAYSTVSQITLNPVLLAGTYTIDPALPAGGSNFQSFTAAVDALLCGITGPVIFNVAAGTYTEQIRIPYIPNTSDINTVTFQSANGQANSVTLTYASTATATNYTLQLDSTRNFIFRNLTIASTNTTYGRALELAGDASSNRIEDNIITAPVVNSLSNNIAGIYASAFKGEDNLIRSNTVNNGAAGIWFAGTSAASLAKGNLIDSNTVNGAYYYGIYASFLNRAEIFANNINLSSPTNSTAYGMYLTNSDSAYQLVGNNVNISNTTGLLYGIFITNSDSSVTEWSRAANNKVTAVTGNTGSIYGFYINASPGSNIVNNVIAVASTGAHQYGLYSTNATRHNYFNNSVHVSGAATINNFAAYFNNGATTILNIRNNIFSNTGSGRAMFVQNTTQTFGSDYNMLYTNGTVLVQRGLPAANYNNLQDWVAGTFWDRNSIVYEPAFTSDSNLEPNLADPDAWAMHGRGVQIIGNDYDFNNNPRPVTLTEGVPDLGAYEFLPTALPTALAATPANPVANSTQTFMYGTDTVMKLTWGGAVPPSVTVRRYSGVVPDNLPAGMDSMYFYTQVETPAGGTFDYSIKQFYIDPWQGSIPDQHMIGLGRTTAANVWVVGFTSTVDVAAKVISQSNLTFMDKFTGLVNPYAPPVLPDKDSSNRGRRFWVMYGHHQSMSGSSGGAQDMQLYLSAQEPATVQVRVNGTNWVRNYFIPANTAIATEPMPKTGADDARILDEGLYDRGISIVSDVPIEAYAHINDGANSGATMLMPVGVYGYEYISLNSSQYYASNTYSWVNVIADVDSTLVEITPSVATKGGRAAGVPFTIYLDKGEVYQIMGTTSGSAGTDLTGTKVRSIANASGKCYPIAVFAGSSRTAICYTSNGDNIIQQIFPYSAWGKRYATFNTAQSSSNTNYNTNKFRVMVKDPTTVVRRNGTILDPTTLITPGNYYEFFVNSGGATTAAVYIEADKPVLVAQYMISTSATTSGSNGCPGIVSPTGNGDPEMIYISPIEQGINKAVFYNTTEDAITSNYINVVIPTAGLASLRIDGNNTFTHVFPHPYLAGYTSVRHNLGGTAGQHIIQSDSAFTAFTYGLGSVESYGYNAGTLVRNLRATGLITNTLNSTGSNTEFTCSGTPFQFTALLPMIPTSLTWNFSQVLNLSPNVDVTINNPTPVGTVDVDGVLHYEFTLSQIYTFTEPGLYPVQIEYTHPDIEGCDQRGRDVIYVQVVPPPKADFDINFSGCVGGTATFTGETVTINGMNVSQWEWTFHDNTTATGQVVTYTYNAPGTYLETLRAITPDGCVGDSTKSVEVNPGAAVNVVEDSISVCSGADTTFQVLNPETGVDYNWYNVATGGTPIATGTSFTASNVTTTTQFWVESSIAGGCVSPRLRVVVTVLAQLPTPVVTVDSVGVNFVKFIWNAVPGAGSYEVSVDGGNTYITPSSGASGLSHTVSGLLPLQEVTLLVRAIGTITCQLSAAASATGRTLGTDFFIPNTFTPNGDGKNDVLLVYGDVIKEMRFMVFNQWGEKIFESTNQGIGWDGRQNGKEQPAGVYMYVARFVLKDNSVVDRKGSIHLVR